MAALRIRLVVTAVAAVTFSGGLSGADVPWTFIGDDTREPASAMSSANVVASFVSWTMDEMTETSPAVPFSSCKPGTVLVIR